MKGVPIVKALVLVGVFALVLTACGSADTGVTTTTADQMTTTTSQPATTSSTVETSTTAATSTTTEPFPRPYLRIVYMLHESGGSPTRAGPFLAPVGQNVASLEDALREWLGGLTPSEIDLGITTEVPTGAELNGVEVSDGVATVDLSPEFGDGESIFSMRARLAQLVYTISGYDPGITGVRLELDGTPVMVFVFSGEALVLDDPMTRASFEDLLPGILIESPAFDGWAGPPVTISGIAATSAGVFQLEIIDWYENVVATATVQTGNGTGWRPFSITFDRSDLPAMPITLRIRVYEPSAEGGNVIHERIQPFGYRSRP
jgi:spore germination protein GerM